MSNSKVKTVLYEEYFDEYARGYFKFHHAHDISLATNYGVLAPIYKVIIGRKFEAEYKIKKTLGVTMHFDSKLEFNMNGIRGFVNKVLLKLLRFLEAQRRKVTDQ